MPVVDVIDEEQYGRLLAEYVPGVIRSDDELDRLALLGHLMEEGGLKQVDLVDCFGSQSVVSAVISGRRRINAEHARRLSGRFGLPMAMFLR